MLINGLTWGLLVMIPRIMSGLLSMDCIMGLSIICRIISGFCFFNLRGGGIDGVYT